MKKYGLFLIISILTGLSFIKCAKIIPQEILKPRLLITLKNDSGKSVSGASVRLYKNASDTGIRLISDSTGIVLFSDLEPVLYYWLAEKGCSTNRISQTTLNRPLIPNAVFYGYSVITETGALKIINNSSEPYTVSDSIFNITIKKDTPYIGYRRVRSYLIHSAKASTPAIGKDTLIKIKCGDTSVIKLPY